MLVPDIRRRNGYLLLALAVGHIVLISAQVNTRSGVPLLQAVMFGVFSEVQRGSSAVVGLVRNVWDEYAALRKVRADNLALSRQVRELQVAIQRERALAGEAEMLRRLLELRDHSLMPTRAAEVIGTSPTADFRSVTIDRGTRDGVRADMAVVSAAGAVGRVVRPSLHAALVQLVIDRNAAVAVMVGPARAQAIAMGTGESLLRLGYLSSTAEVARGDAVVTSGIDGIYPEGFVVGTIEAFELAGGLFRNIRIRPAVDFAALEHVLVVLGPASAAAQERAGAGETSPAPGAADKRGGSVEADSGTDGGGRAGAGERGQPGRKEGRQ